jgi:TetR/AcrR family transcriptional repressor of nem operon
MPWPNEQKERSREKILQSAFSLFAAQGYDKVTISDVMREAQMTHGAFYNHFSSKQELYAEAIGAGARASALAKLQHTEASGTDLLTELLRGYLDVAHVRQKHSPCPLAFLATDVANGEEEVRGAYTQIFKRLTTFMSKTLPADTPQRRERALALAAMMIGGVAVSRALDDERTVKALLRACRAMGEGVVSEG